MRALLLDALGTLVRLDDPVGRLRAALARRGVQISPEDAAQRMRAEIAYYRAEHHRAGTRAGLAELRADCARLAGVDVDVLLEAIHFEPFPEVERVLDECARRGIALAVVSDWDVSLHDVIAELGWTERFGIVVTSAELGVAKPDPRPFLTALDALGVVPADAVHVGDDPEADVGGAAAAGVRGVLLDRDRVVEGPGVVASLDELLD
jgi:putative hydrolase of the HAD superfamily